MPSNFTTLLSWSLDRTRWCLFQCFQSWLVCLIQARHIVASYFAVLKRLELLALLLTNCLCYCKVQFAFSFLVTVRFRPMTNYHVATRDNRPRLHTPEGSLYLTGWPSSIMLLLHLTSSYCLFFSFSFTFAPMFIWCAYWYFSLIASSEPCSSPLTWRLFTTSSRLSRPCEDLPPKTDHSSSPFPFAHSTTNPFHEGITRVFFCHRLHIFRVLWTPPQQKKLTAMQ